MSRAARQQGWRSRAAFKLIELDDRFQLIRRGARVLDLGAAPGGWTQVAVAARRRAVVVGVDLLPIDPVPGAEFLQGDFTDPAMPRAAARAAGRQGRPRAVRHGAQHHRARRDRPSAHHGAGRDWRLQFALEVLAPGGAFVAKVFQGGVGAADAGAR